MNQWMSQFGGNGDTVAHSGSGNQSGNGVMSSPAAGQSQTNCGYGMTAHAAGMNNKVGQQQGQVPANMNMMNGMNVNNMMMNMNNMNNINMNSLPTHGNNAIRNNGMQNMQSTFPMPMQGGLANNNFPPNNSMNARPMNMPVNMGGGFSHSQSPVFQVKTGQSIPMHPFLNMGQQQQQQQQQSQGVTSIPTSFNTHNSGWNPNNGEISRSNSEPLLNTTIAMGGNNQEPSFGLNPRYDQARPASTDMLSTMQQHFGNNGGMYHDTVQNQNHLFELNGITGSGLGKTENSIMGNILNKNMNSMMFNSNNTNMNPMMGNISNNMNSMISFSSGGQNSGISTRPMMDNNSNNINSMNSSSSGGQNSGISTRSMMGNNSNNMNPMMGNGSNNMNSMISSSSGGQNSGISTRPMMGNNSNNINSMNSSSSGGQNSGISTRSMMGNTSNNMNPMMANKMNSSLSCGEKGGSSTRRHSEPACNLLADIFYEPNGVTDSLNTGNNNDNMNNMTGGMGNHSDLLRSADGWSSPPLQETALGTSVSKTVRQRSNSAPLISEMMFDLHNLEPDTVFDEPTRGGLAESNNDQLPRNDNNSNNNNNTRQTGTGKVKRSRSVDPLKMFHREGDDMGLVTPSAHALTIPINDSNNNNNTSHDDVPKGLSADDQQRLESLGVYSLDKPPKRRRSAPLLSQDLFEDMYNAPGGEGGADNANTNAGWNDGQNTMPGPSFTAPGVAPQNPSLESGIAPQNQSFAPPGLAPQNNPVPTQPQNLQQKNNINLIQMLLGIEHGASCAIPGAASSGGQQPTKHTPKTVTGLKSLLKKKTGSVLQTTHQQVPNPAHQPNPMVSALQTQQPIQLNDRPMANSPLSYQQLPSTSSSLATTPVIGSLATTPVIGSMAGTPVPQLQLSSNIGQFANPSVPQQQFLSNIGTGFMNYSNNPVANQGILNNQQAGQSFTAPPPTSSQQAPPPLNINNSEDLTLVLSAVKETQTNLRTLQPMVMQLGDPIAMEDIAKAFKITASSSQFVLASDLASAYASLKDAWASIKKLEDRLAQGPQQPHQQMFNVAASNPNFQGLSMMEQMLIAQAGQNQMLAAGGIAPGNAAIANMPLVMGMTNLQVPSIPNSIMHVAPEKKMEKTTPVSVQSPKPAAVAVQKVKPARLPSKNKQKPKAKKAPSPSPSPELEAVKLEDLPDQSKDNPEVTMKRLQGLMERTQMSQKQLQRWDKKNGLPKSHSQTMVNSSRSRKQLQKGVILKKWNGDPLIAPNDGGDTFQEKLEGQANPLPGQPVEGVNITQDPPEGQSTPSQDQLEDETNESLVNMEVVKSDRSSTTVSSDSPFDNEKPGRKKSDDDTTSMDASEILSEDLLLM